jgi:hypothetical protein
VHIMHISTRLGNITKSEAVTASNTPPLHDQISQGQGLASSLTIPSFYHPNTAIRSTSYRR